MIKDAVKTHKIQGYKAKLVLGDEYEIDVKKFIYSKSVEYRVELADNYPDLTKEQQDYVIAQAEKYLQTHPLD
jgi:hypothetical protein